MPSPSPRVDMNFAMQNGLVDQAALDAAFGVSMFVFGAM
jgi:hypothetical protein